MTAIWFGMRAKGSGYKSHFQAKTFDTIGVHFQEPSKRHTFSPAEMKRRSKLSGGTQATRGRTGGRFSSPGSEDVESKTTETDSSIEASPTPGYSKDYGAFPSILFQGFVNFRNTLKPCKKPSKMLLRWAEAGGIPRSTVEVRRWGYNAANVL